MCAKGERDRESILGDELWEIKTSLSKGCSRTSVWGNSGAVLGGNSALSRVVLRVTYNSCDPQLPYRTMHGLCSKTPSHVSDDPSEVRGRETVHQMSQKVRQPAPLKDKKG